MVGNGKIKDCNKNIVTIVQKLLETTSDNLCWETITRTCILTWLLDLEKCFLNVEKSWLYKERKAFVSAGLRTRICADAFGIHDKESLPCGFRKPCWGSAEHPCTQSLAEDRKYLASAQSEGWRRNVSMLLTFIKAHKFKTFNGLFPFKQLRGLLKVTISPQIPYTTFIHK